MEDRDNNDLPEHCPFPEHWIGLPGHLAVATIGYVRKSTEGEKNDIYL